jgi:hypothetical protein
MPVKQEINGTVILSPFVFPGKGLIMKELPMFWVYFQGPMF